MPRKRKPRNDGDRGATMACVILADPPWKFLTRSVKGKGRSAEAWYDCMTLADIKALPVAQMAAPDSLLLLWTTRTYLEQAFGVIAAWGYVFKTIAFTWVKTTKDGKGFPMGMGYHTRGNPELCLLAARGKGVQRLRRDARELIISPRRKHSQKPNEAYDRIERLWPGPCLELSPVITGRAGNRWATKSTAARSCSGAGRRTATRSPHRKAVEIRRLPDGGSDWEEATSETLRVIAGLPQPDHTAVGGRFKRDNRETLEQMRQSNRQAWSTIEHRLGDRDRELREAGQ